MDEKRDKWNSEFALLLVQRHEISYTNALEIAEARDEEFELGITAEQSVNGWEGYE